MSAQPATAPSTAGATDPAAAAAAAAAAQAALAAMKWDDTYGALLIGGLVAIALWGIVCAQTYVFYERSKSDRPFLRYLIGFLWSLDTFDSALNCHILYHYLVTNFMHPEAVAVPVWSVSAHVFITSLQDWMIRAMFTRRVWQLSEKNVFITGLVAILSSLDLACGCVITAKALHFASFSQMSSISWLFYLNFATGTGSDFLIALALCFYLHRSRTGFPRTESLINVLMMYTINTGLIVALDSTLGMVLYIWNSQNFIFLAFYLQLSKLYLNAYLATLNAREGLRRDITDFGSASTGLPLSIRLSRFTRSTGTDVGSSQPSTAVEKKSQDLEINIQRSVVQETEVLPQFSPGGRYY